MAFDPVDDLAEQLDHQLLVSSISEAATLCIAEMEMLRENLIANLEPRLLEDDEILVDPISFDVLNTYDNKRKKVYIKSVMNPLKYACDFHIKYTQMIPSETKILFVGMNPSTKSLSGIPFYADDAMDELLGNDDLHECIEALPNGYEQNLSSESGIRFHNYVRAEFGSTQKFFDHCFVINYCPLIFKNGMGGNVSLDGFNESGVPLLEMLMKNCDDALKRIVNTLKPKLVVGIGKYAQDRVAEMHEQVVYMYHPAPYDSNATPEIWHNHLGEGLENEPSWIKILEEIADEENG